MHRVRFTTEFAKDDASRALVEKLDQFFDKTFHHMKMRNVALELFPNPEAPVVPHGSPLIAELAEFVHPSGDADALSLLSAIFAEYKVSKAHPLKSVTQHGFEDVIRDLKVELDKAAPSNLKERILEQAAKNDITIGSKEHGA